jgi:hypothetical protein
MQAGSVRDLDQVRNVVAGIEALQNATGDKIAAVEDRRSVVTGVPRAALELVGRRDCIARDAAEELRQIVLIVAQEVHG